VGHLRLSARRGVAAGGQRPVMPDQAFLERLIRPVIERCRGPIEQALLDAGIGPKDIDRLILVGGPTRMPAVRTFFEELCGRPAQRGVDPMELRGLRGRGSGGLPHRRSAADRSRTERWCRRRRLPRGQNRLTSE
jgi:Hsp70 protein